MLIKVIPNMYFQPIQFSNHFLHNQPINHQKRLMFSPNLKFEFCYSSKRMCKSRTISRDKVHLAIISGEESRIEEEELCGDEYYISRCVKIARTAIGCTSPNPMVGCVIVKDGRIVGGGFHPKAGQPHAEVFALRDAGELAENGIAYVSLEPCNHYGRTPPCTEALIKAKVRKVVIGMVDPNPLVASMGVKRLQDAGIEVIVGVEEELCKRLNEAYIHQMLTGRPFVTLRYSMSLSGNLIDQLGETALKSGGYYSKLLQEYDVIVLSSTRLAENSLFPVSCEPGANQPFTIVLSKSPKSISQIPFLPPEAASKVMIISDKELEEIETTREGIQRIFLNSLSLTEILEHCKRQGLSSVLLDLMGAYTDFEDILREGVGKDLIQKVVVEVLPVLGGNEVKAFDSLSLKARVKKLSSRVSGESILLEGYFHKREWDDE